MARRIHITGAAGAGVSTLGVALARARGLRPLDTDDFLWLPSDPPYQELIPAETRLQMLRIAFDDAGATGWVLSGSLAGWGDPLIPRFEAVLYVDTPTDIRLERLRRREAAKLGALILPGGVMYQEHQAFLAWAAAYDDPAMTGRSRHHHARWLEAMTCPVLHLDGRQPTADLLQQTEAFLTGL
jgi:adenylate kinase family enzyme